MIAIVNVTPKDKYGKGWQQYELRINGKVIVTFGHKYENGLAVCLRKAAKAVEGIYE